MAGLESVSGSYSFRCTSTGLSQPLIITDNLNRAVWGSTSVRKPFTNHLPKTTPATAGTTPDQPLQNTAERGRALSGNRHQRMKDLLH